MTKILKIDNCNDCHFADKTWGDCQHPEKENTDINKYLEGEFEGTLPDDCPLPDDPMAKLKEVLQKRATHHRLYGNRETESELLSLLDLV